MHENTLTKAHYEKIVADNHNTSIGPVKYGKFNIYIPIDETKGLKLFLTKIIDPRSIGLALITAIEELLPMDASVQRESVPTLTQEEIQKIFDLHKELHIDGLFNEPYEIYSHTMDDHTVYGIMMESVTPIPHVPAAEISKIFDERHDKFNTDNQLQKYWVVPYGKGPRIHRKNMGTTKDNKLVFFELTWAQYLASTKYEIEY
jgi:hypothetical protein